MTYKQKQLAFELFANSILRNVDFSKDTSGGYSKESTSKWFEVWASGYEFGVLSK